MALRYEEPDHAARQFIAEGDKGYARPDLRRLLTIALRSVIEMIIVLHVLRRKKHIEENVYRELYEQCESLRKIIVELRDKLRDKEM